MRHRLLAAGLASLAIAVAGCSHNQQPANMAPPVNGGGGPGAVASAPPVDAGGQSGVYNWQDVPQNQDVPIARAVFDQGGYQLYAESGETIVVPFANQNLYVMKFGRSNSGRTYFRNEASVPVLYLRPGDSLSNAAAQNARWYPIPDDFRYERPMYVAVAPTWADYTALGWYPGMNYYGGMWGYNPGVHFVWMPSFYIGLGGSRYTSYNTYRTYYTSHPGYVRTTRTFNYSSPRSTGSFGLGRSAGSTGSFGRSRASAGSFGTGRSAGSTGSFGNRSMSGSTSAFGSTATKSSGSFGSTRTRSSFGGGSRSFGGTKPSFGGGSTSARPSGGSFGGSKSSSGFGASRPSFGGGSRSAGGSFGRRR